MTFQPGQSGNPTGRPRMDREVLELARQASPAAMRKLIEFMDHETPQLAISAANSVLDRAYGKPTQMLANDPENPFEVGKAMSADELANQLVAALERAEKAR